MIGKALGHYQISSQLGKGGMGEVFRAKDQKLGRDVAIKVLPEEFAKDADRVARFQREAKLLASLNHPNIAAIYGLEESAGTNFLVLELVEGETLADRIKAGLIPVEESLKLALQIAEALEAAHEKGVIHRDLKPANIKVTPDGKVKVLDFGLAKAFAEEQAELNLSNSPTLSNAATLKGVILGTAAYMSPEQARGESVDKNADIWAFGCVLFEMLTGRGMFEGRTVSDTLAAVLMREPEWKQLPHNLHQRIRLLLERCLEKEAKNRYSGIGDARVDIQRVLADPSGVLAQPAGASARGSRGWRPRRILSVLAVLVVAIGAAIGGWILKPSPPLPVAHVKIGLQPAQSSAVRLDRTSIALSTDGRQIVYGAVSGSSKGYQLYLRALDQAEAVPLPGTEYAENPLFSPDGQWIAFWAEGELKKVPVSGGPPVAICKMSTVPMFGASWESSELIVFANAQGGLWQVAASGGEPKQLTVLDISRGEYSHRLPHLLPGGEAVLFTITKSAFPNWDETEIAVQSLHNGQRRLLIRGGADARYVPSGYLVFTRRGVLMAAPFDLGRLEVSSGAVGVIENVMQAVNNNSPQRESGAAQFCVSANGTLAYISGGIAPGELFSLVWVDLRGVVQRLPFPPSTFFGPRLSPDGQRLVFYALGGSKPRLLLYDIARGTSDWMTAEYSGYASWTPDGMRVAYGAGEPPNLFWQPTNGSADPERLTTNDHDQFPASFSQDGNTLVFVQLQPDATNRWDIHFLSLKGKRQPQPLIQTSSDDAFPDLSPDGRWLAYASDDSGRSEVYVRSFPGPGGRQQISTSGGTAPAWGKKGRELFYMSPQDESGTRAMMAVDVSTGTPFKGMPKILFRGRFVATQGVRGYDVTSDSQRFIMAQPMDAPPSKPVTEINLVINWLEELKRHVPSGKK